jgi:hypothetical protein
MGVIVVTSLRVTHIAVYISHNQVLFNAMVPSESSHDVPVATAPVRCLLQNVQEQAMC